ncbi:MAG: glycosyltransferase family 2 protein [Pseudoflavonifractor sp.]|nr:glycosyltransferase family 2 protein [Alloprevotella sp.]MCM1117471.1 glycosyltransferase family 2 protein [Pseudoflavonifractor sp.]
MTSPLPDISVIVLTFNQEATAARAIKSILAQDTGLYTMEVVVADDCSSDSTRDILERLAAEDPRVRLLPKTPNKGVVANYFDTLRECRGRYVADCAGDDYWLGTDRLLAAAFLLDTHPDASMVYADWIEIAPGEEPPKELNTTCLSTTPTVTDGRLLMEPLLAHTSPLPLHLSAALYRRSLLDEAMTREPEMICNSRFGCEDFPILMALLDRGKAIHIPAAVLAYTVGQSTSVSNPAGLKRAIDYYSATELCTAALARRYGIRSPRLARWEAVRSRWLMAAALRRPVSPTALAASLRALLHSFTLR